VVILDELDGLCPSRETCGEAQRPVIAQLLVLLDGVEARGNVSLVATTNRPEDIDPALRRPGRFDQVLWLGPPDERGRAAILMHYLEPLKIDPLLNRDHLASNLAALTAGLTGADLAQLCRQAVLACVKEAVGGALPPIALREDHFHQVRAALRDPAEIGGCGLSRDDSPMISMIPCESGQHAPAIRQTR
jgi:transitional endoplasmic reticulum ATPase